MSGHRRGRPCPRVIVLCCAKRVSCAAVHVASAFVLAPASVASESGSEEEQVAVRCWAREPVLRRAQWRAKVLRAEWRAKLPRP